MNTVNDVTAKALSHLNNEKLVKAATIHLNELLSLYTQASVAWSKSEGKMGADQAYAYAMQIHAEYEDAKKDYASKGFRNLGIHSIKVGA
jgi:hypothetical protein